MKVAIAGYGAEGKSNYEYFTALGHEVTVLDRNRDLKLASGVDGILGPHALDALQNFDLVVRTAGMNPRMLDRATNVTSSTIEFFDKCPAPIIGVTGTKGKGTTSSFIASILRAAGNNVWLVGNIGQPALDVLSEITNDDIVVYELSSFQLWDLKKSPQTAVILMIEQDHLDVHKDMDEYVRAKANIRLHQRVDDECFYHPTNKYVQQIMEMPGTWANDESELDTWRAHAYAFADPKSQGGVYVKDNAFYIRSEMICSTSVVKLPGRHNLENACAAISAALIYTQDYKAIAKGLSDFNGLPHRLKFVREVDQVSYYDDSIATTPGSAIAAIKSFTGPKVLILGGADKGADFSELAAVIGNSDVRLVILIGEMGPSIGKVLDEAGIINTVGFDDKSSMADIVTGVHELSRPRDTVILSPACSSFDMFTSYKDRGEQFTDAVHRL